MKLYFKSGACSMASHIALHEVAADFSIEEVDLQTKKTADGTDFRTINPKGYVPALELATGEVLTEGASVLQYIADQHPESALAPASGTIERARLQEHLNYVGTELHAAFGPFFNPATTEAEKANAAERVATKFDYLETLFSDDRAHLLGEQFTVADAYLFVVSNWANFVGIDLQRWPNVAAYVSRVANRPATQAALNAEGLLN
jgi:glutathione S-transferase